MLGSITSEYVFVSKKRTSEIMSVSFFNASYLALPFDDNEYTSAFGASARPMNPVKANIVNTYGAINKYTFGIFFKKGKLDPIILNFAQNRRIMPHPLHQVDAIYRKSLLQCHKTLSTDCRMAEVRRNGLGINYHRQYHQALQKS